MSSECSSDETVIYVVKPTPTSESRRGITDRVKTGQHTDEESECEHSEAEKALPKIYSTVNSVSSQDSGINLSFHDSDRSVDGSVGEFGRSSSAESNSNGYSARRPPSSRFGNNSSSNSSLTLPKQYRVANDDLSEDDEIFFSASQKQQGSNDSSAGENSGEEQSRMGQWHCPPKNIWKPTVEAMQEFEMIKDNDRVLVCLAPAGRSSLTLLHTLHQYRFYSRSKGIDFEIGAAGIQPSNSDDGHFAAYLNLLEVPYLRDEATKDILKGSKSPCTSFCEKPTRAKLYALAKANNYNVLAIGQNLDNLTEGFLSSVFNNGKLRTMKAHYYIREQALRVIRPFIYVREKAIKQFTESKKLPIFGDVLTPTDDANHKRNEELIGRQETAYPRLYWSLRSALRPLISAQGTDNEQQPTNKRQQHRRPRTNSFSAVPLATFVSGAASSTVTASQAQQQQRRIEDSDETDEEPVL